MKHVSILFICCIVRLQFMYVTYAPYTYINYNMCDMYVCMAPDLSGDLAASSELGRYRVASTRDLRSQFRLSPIFVHFFHAFRCFLCFFYLFHEQKSSKSR